LLSFADFSPSKSELRERNKHSPSGMRNFKAKNSITIFVTLSLVAAFMTVQVGSRVAEASLLDVIRALVTINPLEVDASSPFEVEVDRVFRVEATATNKGENRIESAEAQIFISGGLVIPVGGLVIPGENSVKQMGVIRGERDKKVFWQVRGEEVGSYVIAIKVSGILEGTEINDEGITLVDIIEKGTPGRRNFLQIFQDFFSLFRR